MDRTTSVALAAGAALVLGALLFILTGDGVLYFSSFFAGSPGSSFGSSLVSTGYAVLVVLVIVFIMAVAYRLTRSNNSYTSDWSP